MTKIDVKLVQSIMTQEHDPDIELYARRVTERINGKLYLYGAYQLTASVVFFSVLVAASVIAVIGLFRFTWHDVQDCYAQVDKLKDQVDNTDEAAERIILNCARNKEEKINNK